MNKAEIIRGFKHFNDHLICAIEIYATGLNPEADDVFNICILPLDFQFSPSRQYTPFMQFVRPRFFDPVKYDWKDKKTFNRMYYSKFDIAEAMSVGIDYYEVSRLFESWFEKLALRYNRKILPVVWDAGRVIPHLREVLGMETFGSFIHPYIRDVLSASLIMNDRAAIFGESYPFQKNILTYLAAQLNIPLIMQKNILMRTQLIAEVYKRMTLLTNGLADEQSRIQSIEPLQIEEYVANAQEIELASQLEQENNPPI